jgi:heme exporter protein D
MNNWVAFFEMGGHGPYIWGSVFMCLLVVALEIWSLGRRRRALAAQAERFAEGAEGFSS